MPGKRRPKNCPKCGEESVARILWGMPAWSEKMEKDEKEGKIIIAERERQEAEAAK